MTDLSAQIRSESMEVHGHSPSVILRSLVIGLTAFLTVVDLFATQAILPSLTRHYNVTPAAMGFAVNASTMGMAVAGLVVGFLSPHIDRRLGILVSLILLAIPTTLLASAPDLTVFTVLRVAQGLCMASAFALTLAYLGEQCSSMDAGGAFAAFGPPALNAGGQVAFAAVVEGKAVPGGVFVATGDRVQMAVAAGEDTPIGGIFAKFSERIGLNDAGAIGSEERRVGKEC